MKKLLFVFLLGAFAACGGGTSDSTTDSTSISTDGSGMSADSTGAGTMSTDTTGM